MKSIGTFIKKHKVPFIICVLALIVIIVLLIIMPSRKERLTNYLEDMGRDYYENFYYKTNPGGKIDTKEFIAKFSSVGIKVNLDTLGRVNDDNKDIISKFKGCDSEVTRAIIYPQKPYGKKDYRISVELDCKGIKSDTTNTIKK